MSFVKTPEEIQKRTQKYENFDFGTAEMVNVFWETKAEIIKKLLPPPLDTPKVPIAHAYIANYPETNFGMPYLESGMFLRAEFEGIEGNYCLAMHLDGPGKDIAMAGGREVFGFPKKLSTISFNFKGDEFDGYSERIGVKNIELEVKFTGKLNDPETPKLLVQVGMLPGKMKNPNNIFYNFKHFPAPEGTGFDYSPRLVRQDTLLRPTTIKIGEAELKLNSSIHDPWAEVEIVRVLGAFYQTGNISMLKGEVIAEVEPERFDPYSFLKWDW